MHVKASANNVRGKSEQYGVANLLDGNKETYWATDDNITKAEIEIDLKEPKTINFITLQEYIKLGQRVKNFTVEVWKNDKWEQVTEATTIGYKRIVAIEPIETSKLKINITASKACPVISNIEVY